MSRSLSETPSAPFKAMLSHNGPRHIRLANAAVSSNFVSLQSPWARYLKSSSPSGEMAAAREVLDEIEGIVDYATSLMSWPLGFTTMDLRLQS